MDEALMVDDPCADSHFTPAPAAQDFTAHPTIAAEDRRS
jgi:hypothetical protein